MGGSDEVLIHTTDIVAATKFYEEKLGMRRFFYGPTLIGLDAGGFRLFLDRGPAFGPVFEFLVADVAAKKAELLGCGCSIEQEDVATSRCYMRDPFGLIFNLAPNPEPPSQQQTDAS